jgi:hypothetical protein
MRSLYRFFLTGIRGPRQAPAIPAAARSPRRGAQTPQPPWMIEESGPNPAPGGATDMDVSYTALQAAQRVKGDRLMLCSHVILFALLLLFNLAGITVRAAAAPDYTFRTVDAPGSDVDVQATWINNSGLISQQYQSPKGAPFPQDIHTALLSGDAWTVIDLPGAVFTGGSNANSHGQVALTYTLPDGILHVAIYDQGKYLIQPDVPGYQVGAQGLNDRGQLAASAIDEGGTEHGFVGTSSAHTIFDYPGGNVTSTTPFMVNNRGTTVGRYTLSDGTAHAFVYEGDQFRNIDPPGSVRSVATGINERNEIIGVYRLSGGQDQGFLLRDGQYTALNYPGAITTIPYSINDIGDVAGIYTDASGRGHGFVATRASGR